jgi:Phage integrase, N-terminal SAM-like domain
MAEAERRRLEREVSEDKHLGAKGTVPDLLDNWLEHVERISRRPATVDTYRTVIEAHLLPALGAVELRKLTAHDLDAYYTSKARAGGNARQKSAGLGSNTIRQHHALLSSALTQAVKWGWIDKNPAAADSPPGRKKSGRKALKPDEIRDENCRESKSLLIGRFGAAQVMEHPPVVHALLRHWGLVAVVASDVFPEESSHTPLRDRSDPKSRRSRSASEPIEADDHRPRDCHATLHGRSPAAALAHSHAGPVGARRVRAGVTGVSDADLAASCVSHQGQQVFPSEEVEA